MSLNNAQNKVDDTGKLDIESMVNPDSIPTEKADLSGSLMMANNFDVWFWKGWWWKSEVKNQNEKVVDYGNGVKVTLDPHKKYSVCDNPLTNTMGTKVFNWHKETYYTSNPNVRHHFNIHKTACPVPGVHIATWWDGTVRDKDGYIVVAAHKDIKFGTVVKTSLWPWKVYDRWKMGINHYDIFTNRW